MHNPDSAQENKTHKTHWDFMVQTDHLISAARRPDLARKNKTKKKKEKKRKETAE